MTGKGGYGGDSEAGVVKSPMPAKMRMSSFGDEEELAKEILPSAFLKNFQDQAKGALREYFLALTVDESVSRLKDLLRDWPSEVDEVGVLAIRDCLERQEAEHGHLVELLLGLRANAVLDSAALVRSFEKLFSTWEDIAIDVPKAPEALLGILHKCVDKGLVKKSMLTKLPESLLKAGLVVASPDFRETLNCIAVEMKEFKAKVTKALGEYFVALDVNEVSTLLRELDRRAYHHEFVKKAIALSFQEHKESAQQATYTLLQGLATAGLLLKDDLQWGVSRLLGQLDDLCLDCPKSVDMATEFLSLMVAGELVSVPFLRWCRLLRIGGATGLRVLESVQRKTPEFSRRHHGTADFKADLQTMILEYFSSGDAGEFGRCVRELAPLSSERSAEIVRKLMVFAMERSPSECDLAMKLLVSLNHNEELDTDTIERGFDDLYSRMDELVLDVPSAKELAASFVKEAKQAQVLGYDWPYDMAAPPPDALLAAVAA